MHAESIREAIDAAVEDRGERPFLLAAGEAGAISYAALGERVRGVAARLNELGVLPGDRVAFMLENGVATAELFLGILYGGAVAAPLDVRAGSAGLAEALAQTRARVVLADPAYAEAIRGAAAAGAPLTLVPAHPDQAPEWPGADRATSRAWVRPPPAPDDAALLNFTSGTTGRPKGVLHTQRQVLANAWTTVAAHALRADDRALCVLPLYHVNAQTTILLPTLLAGGSLVLPRRFDRARYWDQAVRFDCSWLPLAPAMIAQLLAAPAAAAPPARRVRFARTSSAPLAPAQHRAFEARFRIPLLEMMGATEAGGIVFANPVPERIGEFGEGCRRKIGSVGIPWRLEANVVDPEGRAVADGATGEIAIRSPHLAAQHPAAANAAPLARTRDGFLLTGDRGHRDADGYFFVTGRAKEIINKGGHKIAPREIDEALARHPEVCDAAAVGVPDLWFGETIVAFVVAQPGAACDEEALLAHCERQLGPLRTPDRIGRVEALPRGPSGKLQRLSLREAALRLLASRRAAAPRASRTAEALEREIVGVWAEALGRAQVDRDADFFELGGYSLLAIQVMARLRRKRGIQLELGDFFAHPTVAGQAAALAARAASPTAGACELAPTATTPDADAPLSLGQERLWLLERLGTGAPAYNEATALRLRGTLRVELLERSLQAIHSRHSVLRVAIEERNGSPRQRVRDDRPFALERLELGPEASEPDCAELRALAARRFDLASDPLFRATLIRIGEADHVLLLCAHHIVCDTWSFDLLYRELSALYTALAAGDPPLLAHLPLQFTDFARWERAQSAPRDAALAHWRALLADAPETPALRADRQRPDAPSERGAIVSTRLGLATTQALQALAQREGATFFMLLVALWKTLLHRWTARSDLLLGTPVTRRTRGELEAMIGFFVDTQVLRTELGDDPVFLDLLARVRAGVAGACAHPLPFEELVAALRPERSALRTPFVEVMLNYRDLPRPLPALPGLAIEPLAVHNGCAKFDLTLSVVAGASGLETTAEVRADLFEPGTIERLLRCFERLAEDVAKDPARRLSGLSLASGADLAEAVALGAGPRVAYPREATIPDLFASAVARAPQATAARFEKATLRYAELNARASQLANRLRELGVGPDVLVGVALERSPELLIALLGILAAGGAYVPLDPADPPARLGRLIADTRAPLILTLERHAQALREACRRAPAGTPEPALLRLDADAREIDSQPSVAPRCEALTAEHLAYVLYTSGSTGDPKGVCVPHRAVVRLATTAAYAPIGPEEVMLQYAPLGFDASTFEIWGALLSGASLAVFPPRLASLDELGRFIEASGVTTLWLTAGLFQQMVETQLPRLHGVRQLLAGGDVLSPAHVRKLREELPDLRLVNGYGPTEATVFSCCHVVGDAAAIGARVPIGRPIANAEVQIFDAARRPVPIGVAGELYIGGDGLARGYLRAPAQDAERFVPHPFAPGERLYRSGDLACWRADGALDFLGRSDAQVKVRGHRIEPAEIEAALLAHPAVREAAVVARGGDAAAKELAAFVVSAAAGEEGELRGFLAARLPARLVPNRIVRLPALPLTSNGKLDRRALASFAPARSAEFEFVPPRSDVEEQIAKLFEAALGIPQVGAHDDFFALGGHSLLAVRVHARLNRILGSDLPLAAFFQSSTVAGLARALGEAAPDAARATVITLAARGVRAPLFCVHGTTGFRKLSRHLGPDQPIHGLAQGFDDGRLATGIEGIAARYLEGLRSLQGKGPYALIGYSLGGLIALEMARRLRAEGEEIRLLALVDPSKLRSPRPSRNTGLRLRRRGRRRRTLPQRARLDLLRLAASLYAMLRRPLPPRLREPFLEEVVFGRVYRRAARAYQPSAYPGRILLFASEQRTPGFEAAWARIAEGGIEVHRIPGGHLELMGEAAIRAVAEQLAPRLDLS
ncbi:MAG TPA: amino acid adenylation domain-containing protein [Myxococcota bacterium]